MRRLVVQSTVWLVALVGALGWYYLAPTSLGGSTTYVVTDGVSMLPRFHGGDLVLVRAQPSYHVGEIVAYRSKMLHTIVLHRIVGRDGNRYVFKGDNNNFLDVEHPARDQLLGRLWLHLPGMGTRLTELHSPITIAICTALATFLLLGGAFERRRRRGRHRGALREARSPSHEWRSPVLAAGLAAIVPFALLTALSFGRSESGPRPASVAYTQSGAFSYSARARSGTAYPRGRATTGDPLFLTLVDAVRFGFSYRFDSASSHTVAGTAALAATLTSSTGWSRTFPLQRSTPFAGDRVALSGSLRLAALAKLQQRLKTTTGTPASYSLTVAPDIHVHGTAGGLPVATTFTTPLTFSFDAYEVQLVAIPQPETGVAQTDTSSTAPKNALTPSSSGSATGTRTAPRMLSLGPLHASVASTRRLSVLGLAAAILCLLLGYPAGLERLRRRRGGEAERIRARYSRFIVPIARLEQVPQRRVVHVSDMDALARVAERYERMILHERRGGRDSFCVSDDGVLYRYVVDGRSHAEPPPPIQLRRA